MPIEPHDPPRRRAFLSDSHPHPSGFPCASTRGQQQDAITLDPRAFRGAGTEADAGGALASDLQLVARFLRRVLGEATRQTAHVVAQNLHCTWRLLRALPPPLLDSARLLAGLWLAVLRAVLLVGLVLFHRAVVAGLSWIRSFGSGFGLRLLPSRP